jgi:membrane protease YdiL (CAAX protease family)
MSKKSLFTLVLILFVTLTNYQVAKLLQNIFLHIFPHGSYQLSISFFWLLIAIVLAVWTARKSGLKLNIQSVRKNWKFLLSLMGIVVAGLLLFVILHITRYFHNVKSPIIFFLVTPIVEELLFRGWIYGQLQKMKFPRSLPINPVVGSAFLFGLHHLQYFNYHLTLFAVFQMGYTFVLGLVFGEMRKKSQSIYPSLFTHILINFITVYF